MNELEGERERRWKSEQATKKLADHIKYLQIKGEETYQNTFTSGVCTFSYDVFNPFMPGAWRYP